MGVHGLRCSDITEEGVRGVRPSNRGWVSKVHRGVASHPSTPLTKFTSGDS